MKVQNGENTITGAGGRIERNATRDARGTTLHAGRKGEKRSLPIIRVKAAMFQEIRPLAIDFLMNEISVHANAQKLKMANTVHNAA